METNSDKVIEFHLKHGFPLNRELSSSRNMLNSSQYCRNIGQQMAQQSRSILDEALVQQAHGDERLYRAYLMLEEMSELLTALGIGDIIEAADAVGDLMYVVIGTAVTYGIPVQEIFEEVHRSNMTKPKRTEDDPRMRNKGSKYSPPDIEGILNEHSLV